MRWDWLMAGKQAPFLSEPPCWHSSMAFIKPQLYSQFLCFVVKSLYLEVRRKCQKRTQATPLLLKHLHLDLENRTWWSVSSDGCPNTGLDDITLHPKVGEGTHHRAASKRQCPNSTFLATLPPLSPATQNIGCPKQMTMAKHTCAPHPNA